ncbi:C1D [Mytilus coruscus]|uniref:Nuclear nucleic acid-binding protein C1D n=1 Tax=Mytilus coruscus TaxID=42192 RepID=A0A6J8CYS5_MYTCO|nr:C1D [Mytilus coruscus]
MDSSGIPKELKEKLTAFDLSLTEVEKTLKYLVDVPQNELNEKMTPLDKAKLDLTGAYTINSLFWMYLNVCGINPKEHAVKQELDRIRSYMNRVKDIQDKAKAPKLDKGAAKRFVKSSLWQAAKDKIQEHVTPKENKDKPIVIDDEEPETSGLSRKRKRDSQTDDTPVKHSKKKKKKKEKK